MNIRNCTLKICCVFLLGFLGIIPLLSDADIVTEPIRQFGLGWLRTSAYSPDGQHILTAGGGGVYLWEITSTQIVKRIKTPLESAEIAVFSPDGDKLVTSTFYNPIVTLWDVNTCQKILSLDHSFLSDSLEIVYLTYFPDGSKVLTAGRHSLGNSDVTVGHLLTWDANTGELLKDYGFPNDLTMGPVSMSPRGDRIAAWTEELGAIIWDANSGEQMGILDLEPEDLYCLTFSPDGMQILTGGGSGATLWNSSNGEMIRSYPGHEPHGVRSVAFSPDGALIATGGQGDVEGGVVMLWEAATGEIIHTLTRHAEAMKPSLWNSDKISLSFSPDGASLLSSGERTARLWDSITGEEIQTFVGHTDECLAAALSPDGQQVLTASYYDQAIIWDVETGEQLQVFGDEGKAVHHVDYAPTGDRILTVSGLEASVWDVQTGVKLISFTESMNPIAVFSPDGTQVLTQSSNTAKLWDIETGELINTFVHGTQILCSAISPDGTKVLLGGADTKTNLYDAAVTRRNKISTFVAEKSMVWTVAFPPDGRSVLIGESDVGSDQSGLATLWDIETGEKIRTYQEIDGFMIWSVDVSQNERMVLTGGGFGIDIWDAASGIQLRHIDSSGTYCQFSSDSSQILSTSFGMTMLWNIEDLFSSSHVNTFNLFE